MINMGNYAKITDKFLIHTTSVPMIELGEEL
ncbi:uncharacterized protein METZ01_LOCUS484263 [marine metagenome]|uniref:Uncharacterized protein n=1 Tax=marine metagenome TaxID=408172 RepID=A0A383CH74_9ZZZZ